MYVAHIYATYAVDKCMHVHLSMPTLDEDEYEDEDGDKIEDGDEDGYANDENISRPGISYSLLTYYCMSNSLYVTITDSQTDREKRNLIGQGFKSLTDRRN